MNIDRLSIRERPAGRPVMHQTWSKLLFLNWPVPAAHLRLLIPSGLEIDTFDRTAWISVTPFTMPRLRPPLLPPPPLIGHAHEINVRTYVHAQGVPGVWFFSLDANNTTAVLGARLAFALPYFRARISLEAEGDELRFSARRSHPRAPAAAFEASWHCGEKLAEARPGSRIFFLTERYCLYAARGGRLYRARIHHDPWTLRRAKLRSYASTMLSAIGVPEPVSRPLTLAQDADLDVAVWLPAPV